jgi:hypothetical protein
VAVFWVRGILFAFGGDVVDTVTWEDNGSSLKSFEMVPVYEPIEGRWGTQTASETIPEPRDRSCSVSVQSDDGTYEIFIFEKCRVS